MKHKNPYSSDFKQQVLDYYKTHNKADTLKNFNISYYTLSCWADPQYHQEQINYAYKNRTGISRGTKKKKQKEEAITKPIILYQPVETFKPCDVLKLDHLEYKYTLTECQREFDLLCKKPGNLNPVTTNKIILTFQSHFYEEENKLWKENKNNFRETLVRNREKYLFKDRSKLVEKELLRGFKISGAHIGFSHFNPLWIRYFIEQYNIKSIYDPCGGWGHRLLGAYNIKYIYNDLDGRSYAGVKNIAKFLHLENKIFYNYDCTNFIPHDTYEAVFTCPPYFNTEIYQDKQFKDIDEFKDFWRKVIICSMKPDTKYFAYVINNEYKEMTQCICKQVGLKFIQQHIIDNKNNHFQRVSKESKKGESVIVYGQS